MRAATATLLLLCAIALATAHAAGSGARAKPTHGVTPVAAHNPFLAAVAAPNNCTTCPDGMECCDGYKCCPYDNPGEYMCCSSDESCCVGECCLMQTTFCCAKTSLHPDRCCPRWTICCTASTQDGCCTPLGHPWQAWMGMESPSEMYKSMYPAVTGLVGESYAPSLVGPLGLGAIGSAPGAGSSIYGLFVETDKVFALTIDATTGKIASQRPVPFNNYGEMTRIWMFDERRALFYYVEANFTAPPAAQGRVITLWTVDPTTGGVTSKVVTGGAVNFPTGYYYDCAADTIYMATQVVQSATNETVIGTQLWSLKPTDAKATLVSTMNLADTLAYAGWIHAVSPDGTTAYRLGFKDVDTQSYPGLSIASLTARATVKWTDNVPVPPAHGFYSSCQPIRGVSGNPQFYSLSAKATATTQGWDLVRWSLGGTANITANLGADTIPRFFGGVAESFSCDQKVFAGALYGDGSRPILDAWVLAMVNLATGNVTQYPIEPEIAETWSVTAIGLPFATAQTFLRR